MTVDPVALTLELCAIPSLTGDERAMMTSAASHCERLGLSVRTQSVAGDRVNVLAVDEKTELLFTTHLDTVPPFIPPRDVGDRLTGRGTCDAKGAAAAMLTAVSKLRASGEKRVGLLFVVGEETISDGAKAAVTGFAPKVSYLINGEPTGMQLCSGQKGTLTFKISSSGVACHSAYPELGRSAVHGLVHTLSHLIDEKWPTDAVMGDTTINVGLINGGSATNMLADGAQASGIMRLAVPLSVVEKRLQTLMPEHVTYEKLGGNDPTILHVPNGETGIVVRFGSDVPYLKALGTPLMLGPGSIHDAHTINEHVLKADLHAAAARYESLARTLLG